MWKTVGAFGGDDGRENQEELTYCEAICLPKMLYDWPILTEDGDRGWAVCDGRGLSGAI